MKMNKVRRLLTLALVLITVVVLTASLTFTASASEEDGFEITVVSEAHNTCGMVRISWPRVANTVYYVIYINDQHVASLMGSATAYNCSGYDLGSGRVPLEIGTSYEFKVVAMGENEVLAETEPVTVTPQHYYGEGAYTSDATHHWCKCGEAFKVPHVGGTATCVTQAVCEVCGTSYGALNPNNHETEETYFEKNDDYTHNVRHSCCGALKETLEHAPSYVYSLDGSTITADCQDCGYKNSVTLYAPVGTLVYDKDAKRATVSANIFGLSEDDVVYKKDGAVIAGAPATVGEYTAELTLGTETAVVSFTIEKAIVTVPSATDRVYTGAAQYSGITSNEYYTVTDNGGTAVGTYSATVELNDKENYAWADGGDAERSFSYDITPAQVKAPEADNTVFTYTGSEQTYNIAKSDLYTVSGNKATDADTYTVTVTLNDKHNYTWADGTTDDLTFSFVIGAASAVIDVNPDTVHVIYGNKLSVPEASSNFGNVTVTLTDTLNNSYDVDSVLNAGIYFLYYTVEPTSNWYGASAHVQVSVNKAPTGIDVDGSTINLIYGSPLVLPTATPTGFGTVNSIVLDSEGNEFTDYDNITVGTYTILYTIDATDNWYASKAEVKVKVASKYVSIPEADNTVFTYNGVEQTYVIAENELYEIFDNKQTAAGDYTVTVSLKDAANFCWEDGTTAPKTYTFSIAKKVVTVTAKPVSVEQYHDYPGFDFDVDGFVNGEYFTEGVVLSTAIGSTLYVGDFDIELAAGAVDNNYTINYVSAKFTVTEHVTHEADAEVIENYIDPDCTNSGSYEIVTYCKWCGKDRAVKETVTVDATGHTVVTDYAVAETCTQSGLTEGSHCSVCYATLVAQTVIPATGHTEVKDDAVAADCVNSGLTEGSHCSVCGDSIVLQIIIPALGHDVITEDAVAPGCTTTGLTEGSYCGRCDTVLAAQQVVPATGHTVVTDAAVAPGCTTTGLTEGSHCSVCNEVLTEQEVVGATGHNPGADADCINDQTCTACGEVLKEALGHDYNVTDTATCTKSGYLHYVCVRCSHETFGGTTEPKGHKFGAATCVSLPICSVCGGEDVTAEYAPCEYTWTTNGDKTHNAICPNSESHSIYNEACTAKNEATCTVPEICSVCDGAMGKANGHSFKVSCTDPRTCVICGDTEGDAPGHTTGKGIIDSNVCVICDEVVTEVIVKKAIIVAAAILIVILAWRAIVATPTTTPWWKRIFRR